jgi:leucyl-tRNA synthetase
MKDFNKLERKWQSNWEKNRVFEVKKSNKKKFYCLEMFPYPSGSGLHMGHALNYTIGDIYARFKRMNNLNVLYPMGYDAFGLPAENAAIKAGEHPKSYTQNSIKNFINQQKKLGLSYSWERIVKTCEPEYYKWNQYFFLKFFEKGLVYRKKSPVNWCPKCNTVLANEQVHNGKCWRHEDTDVEVKHLEQWFIKTTKYADELLKDIPKLEWPDRIKAMQKNWIGKSYGTEILFEINGEPWKIFTTRPDTIFGVTFMVVSAQHPRLKELVTKEQEKEVSEFLKKVKRTSQKDAELLEKEGAFTGSYALNPINNEKFPVYTGNFVLADYGSGMVMAVPAHDQRDFEFAKKYKIPIKVVINPHDYDLNAEKMIRAFTSDGVMVNSGEFNGLSNRDGIDEITKYLQKKKLGKKTKQYKLKDWLISRQRYWGTPIPIIYCDKCGPVPVPEKDLPVKLPEKVEFGKGNPLVTNKSFVEVKCPKCNSKAKRETDTMDTFFDSSWYFLRYCDNKNDKEPFSKEKAKYWMPVDQYIGGAEHACMHLIYARFFTKALRDLGFLKINEPFTNLFNQGMLHAADGNKMSKSLGNVINPLEMIEKYGADSLRLALMSFASPDKDTNWDEKVLIGSYKFLIKVKENFSKIKFGKADARIESKLNKTIKEVTEQIENFKYNLAIIKIRELFNSLPKKTSKDVLEKSLILLHPFCPHLTEELWEKLGNKKYLSLEKWPKFDAKKIDEKLDAIDEMIENTITDIDSVIKLTGIKKPKQITLFIADKWKYSLFKDLKKILDKTRNTGEIMKQLMSKPDYKKYGKDVSALIPKLVKDTSKLPEVVLSQEMEAKALNEKIKEEFKVNIIINKAEGSQEAKAKQALPGKPAILIK